MHQDDTPFCRIEDAVDDLRGGRMVIVVDDPDRENEGDLCLAARSASPEALTFMISHGRGLVCLPMPPERCDELGLPPMVAAGEDAAQTAFTVTIDAREGIESGISASDRAQTARLAALPGTVASDLVRPGHLFPLRARPGGVLERTGHTEASVDLVRLAGFDPPVAVICEVLNADGTVARLADLTAFAREHGLRIVTIADLVAHRASTAVDALTLPAD